MTRQEAFDRVWRHFVTKRNGPSVGDSVGGPMYRGDGGSRCAIGLLVTNREYRSSWEGDGVEQIVFSLPDRVVCLGIEFLGALQECHDGAYMKPRGAPFSAGVEERLRELANEYDLAVPS